MKSKQVRSVIRDEGYWNVSLWKLAQVMPWFHVVPPAQWNVSRVTIGAHATC
jgi:hypothetical protein